MVSLIEVVKFLRSELPEVNIYPIEYPIDSPDSSCIVEMQATTEAKAELFPLNVQIKVRDTHPSLAEKTCFQMRGLLENKTDFMLGSVQVVMVKSQNPVPLYIGKDQGGNFLYSNNFRFIINEGVKQ